MKHIIKSLVLLCAGCSLAIYCLANLYSEPTVGAAGKGVAKAAIVQAPPDTNPAMNEPDKFVWGVFAQISQPSGNPSSPGDSTPVSWEFWSNDIETFPGNPGSPSATPCFPNNPDPKYSCPGTKKKIVRPSTQQQFLHGNVKKLATAQPGGRNTISRASLKAAVSGTDPFNPGSNPQNGYEEVNRNLASFNYIVRNNLWSVSGLTQQFKNGFVVNFPTDAIEIKARWLRWSDIQKSSPNANQSNYHISTFPDPANNNQSTPFGLVALHVMTKDVPNWIWATWEQEDNPGRCDYIGCHDKFGVTPANVQPNSTPGGTYPPGTLTPDLLAILKNIGAEWQHYRLKGSQIDFIDTTGQPVLLGNSVTEAGFVQTSSCMTCHVRATFNPSPTNSSLSVFQPTTVKPPKGDQAVAFFGSPNDTWYFQNPFNPLNVPKGPSPRLYMETDFVWSIPFFAQ